MDMTVRLMVGVVLLAIGLAVPLSLAWKVVALVIAVIALITGIIRYCPVNSLIGLNTCARQSQQSQSQMK